MMCFSFNLFLLPSYVRTVYSKTTSLPAYYGMVPLQGAFYLFAITLCYWQQPYVIGNNKPRWHVAEAAGW